MNIKTNIIIWVLIVLIILAAAAAIVGWRRQLPVVSKTEFVNVPQIKTVTKIQRIRIPVKEIVVLEKKAVVAKLKLEEPLASDETQQIVATATLPPSECKINTLAVMDTATGETQIVAKQEPPPFFAFENKREIGLRYGFGSMAATKWEADAYCRWDFLRLGNAHIGVYGEVTSMGDSRAMLSVSYRW